MTFSLVCSGRKIEIAAGQSILEALEGAEIPVNSSCRAGACQSCLMKLVEGSVPLRAQEGLSTLQKQSGHFLACICYPTGNLSCEPPHGAAFEGSVTLHAIEPIGPRVVRVRLRRPANFDFEAGQFVSLRRDQHLMRSYSIASSPDLKEYFDLHVRRIEGGRMSSWLHEQARPGDQMRLEGPRGTCYYQSEDPSETLSLIGTGTGVAPLYAIVEAALQRGHRGVITLIQGGVSEESLYWQREIEALAAQAKNVRYLRCVLHGPVHEGTHRGELATYTLASLGDLKAQRIFLAGDAALVRQLKKQLFLAGASLRRIHADPFEAVPAKELASLGTA